jgi:PAS domain S-box-containing protein
MTFRAQNQKAGGFEERYWSPVNSPVLGADNEVAYIIHRVEDVTHFVQLQQQQNEQHQENQALRVRTLAMEGLRIEAQAAQEQLARVLAGIDDQFLVLDREGRYTYVSDRVSSVVGIPKEGLLGKSIWELFPDTVGTQFYTEVRRAVAEQTRVHFEYFYPRWQQWFENRVYPSAEGVSIFVADITDRKLAEKALQESEERARLAIKVGRLGTWRYDPSTDLVELDERMREIWGEPDDAVTLPLSRVMERIHPDDRARVANAVSAALAPSSSGTYEIDYRVVWSDGTEQWLLANGQAQFEGEGVARRSNGFLGTALNITDRKQLEATLRHSEQRYRSLIEATSQIIWDTRAEGEFVTEQPGWSAFTGQTFDELKGWGWLNAVHPDDQAHTTQVWSTAVALSTLYEVEHRLRRHDGMYRNMSVRAVPVFEEDGTIREWIGIHTDVTDRKQAEEALRQREAELRLITNAVPVLISFIDSEQRYRFNNQKYKEWFGHLPSEIYGESLRDVLGEAAYATIRPYVERVLAGEQVTFESQIPDQDGATRYVDATYIPQFDTHRAVVGFVALVSDISDRKRAEAEQQKLITLIDNSPDFIGIASMDGQAQYVNPAGRAMVGLDSLKQVQQIQVIDCFLPEDRAFVQEHILPTALRDGT